MELKSYPIFAPPITLASKPHREWTKKEAQSYFDWLTGCLDARVTALLDFVGIQNSENIDARDLLAQVGERVAQVLRDPACSETASDGTPVLTGIGYALAADLGLLTARQVCRIVGHKARWELVRKPKSDVSYNLPVLVGFGSDTYDPVGVSIADAIAVLAGRRSWDAWVKVFDSCIADARKDGQNPDRG
jgi:hypothetical protein